MTTWILIAVIFVGLIWVVFVLNFISQQLRYLQLQLIDFQNNINNIANKKQDSSESELKINYAITSLTDAVEEIRDYLVPPEPRSLRAEIKDMKEEFGM
jgi:hypothetical protein